MKPDKRQKPDVSVIYIRGEDDLCLRLKDIAAKERRSLTAQAVLFLEQGAERYESENARAAK